MSHDHVTKVRRTGSGAALAIMVAFSSAGALAQSAVPVLPDILDQRIQTLDLAAGRIALDFPQAPPASIEIDLSPGILGELANISEAAMSGVAEAILESQPNRGPDAVQRSVEHMAAMRQVVQTLGTVVRELHVRVYDPMPGAADDVRARMVAHYQEKLREADWDNLVRIQENHGSVTLAVLHRDGAIRGVFAIISEGNDCVVANAICDLTPEKVKLVTHQLTKIGMEYGLGQAIENMLRDLDRPRVRRKTTEVIGRPSVPVRD